MTASNLISILDLVFKGGLRHSKFKLIFECQGDNPMRIWGEIITRKEQLV